MKPFIYLDHAATTPISPGVSKACRAFEQRYFGNPSSGHLFGEACREQVKEARALIASSIGAEPEEIYFTSGGTESDNWALKSCIFPCLKKRPHIITSAMEHPAIRNSCRYLETLGCRVTELIPGKDGRLTVEQVEAAIRPDTRLITVMTANNEIGTIQPICSIGELARDYDISFHTDAVQAYGHIPLSVKNMPVDYISTSAHKLNGPKGIGFLYTRKGKELPPLLHGGKQEDHRRAGTENSTAIIGFAQAVKEFFPSLHQNLSYVTDLRNHFYHQIKARIPEVFLNGCQTNRLPGNLNLCFPGISGESLLSYLSYHGICASAGSACSTGNPSPSHVLTAIGLTPVEAFSSLRFSLDRENTPEEIRFTLQVLEEGCRTLKP